MTGSDRVFDGMKMKETEVKGQEGVMENEGG